MFSLVVQMLKVTELEKNGPPTHTQKGKPFWRDAGRAQSVGQWPHRKASEQHVQGQSPSHSLPRDVRAIGREKMTLLASRGMLDTIAHQDRALRNTWVSAESCYKEELDSSMKKKKGKEK